MRSIDHLHEANRRKSEQSTAAAIEALQAMLANGFPISVNGVAQQAGVARSFIYGKPELLELIATERARSTTRLRPPPTVQERSTELSLRHRLADALDRIQELTEERDTLARQYEAVLAANRQLRQTGSGRR